MSKFHFDISLNILNHLGRNLYRNFITVVWEAISNSWDACANNVYIYIENDNLIVLDDWIWMNEDDFQQKFLNIWYSKRLELWDKSSCWRQFIGRKWIWKLALLSCAQRVHILSKTNWNKIIGWIIDNSILDEKINNNLKTDDYPLEDTDTKIFSEHPVAKRLNNWTIILFEDLNEWIKSNLGVIRTLIALHFRFSLIDPGFNILVNDVPISFKDLKQLSENTQFMWVLNNFKDDYFSELLNLKEWENLITDDWKINGFIASVQFPKFLNVYWTWEKAWIDLFVNGRLRETNILKNMSWFSTRHVASYLYGQIHINDLDDEIDRFTSSREWIKPWDEKYWKYLKEIEKQLSKISKKWDEWRKKHKDTWDIENGEMPKFQALIEQSKHSREKDFEQKIDGLDIEPEIKHSLKEKLRQQSSNNTSVYQDLFILENLFREYIKLKWVTLEWLEKQLGTDADIKKLLSKTKEIKDWRYKYEETHDLKWKIVKYEDELNYIDFVYLAILVDIANKSKSTWRYTINTMESHSKEILAIRNPIMHTNEITDEAFN